MTNSVTLNGVRPHTAPVGKYWDCREARWVEFPEPPLAPDEVGVPEPRAAVENESEADVRSG